MDGTLMPVVVGRGSQLEGRTKLRFALSILPRIHSYAYTMMQYVLLGVYK
jgi:hypothetical protein